MRGRVWASSAMAVLLSAGCGSRAVTAPVAETTLSPSPKQPPAAEGPSINWDNPMGGTGIITDFAHAQASGGLPFSPVRPNFDAPPVRVSVSDPAETLPSETHFLTAVYKFPAGSPGFGEDGRVLVMERDTTLTSDDLKQVLADPPGPASGFQLIDLQGVPGLLITNADKSIGRVEFIRDGVMFDVTGPSLSPDTAQTLAGRI